MLLRCKHLLQHRIGKESISKEKSHKQIQLAIAENTTAYFRVITSSQKEKIKRQAEQNPHVEGVRCRSLGLQWLTDESEAFSG